LADVPAEAGGRPVRGAAKDDLFHRAIWERTPEQAVEFILEAVAHHTHKAGALLGAPGIVVAIFALDYGWPRSLTIAAMLLLLLASLILITTLNGSTRPLRGRYRLIRIRAAQRSLFPLQHRALCNVRLSGPAGARNSWSFVGKAH